MAQLVNQPLIAVEPDDDSEEYDVLVYENIEDITLSAQVSLADGDASRTSLNVEPNEITVKRCYSPIGACSRPSTPAGSELDVRPKSPHAKPMVR